MASEALVRPWGELGAARGVALWMTPRLDGKRRCEKSACE